MRKQALQLGLLQEEMQEFDRWSNSKTLDDHYLKVVHYRERAHENNHVPRNVGAVTDESYRGQQELEVALSPL